MRFFVVDELLDEQGPYPFGPDTRGVADEEEGGIILYCHRNIALDILEALRNFYGADQSVDEPAMITEPGNPGDG